MQTYCSTAQLEAKYGADRIGQFQGDAQDAIDAFASKINSRLRIHFPELPFDETNEYLNQLNLEGAYVELERTKPTGLSEIRQKDADRLDKELDRVASRQVDPGDFAEGHDEEEESVGFFEANTRLFGRRTC